MKRGYIRTVPGGISVKAQKAALSTAGLDVDDPYGPVYIDDRDAAIASLEAGDELVIAEPACLGTTGPDALEAIAEIGRRSATVLDLSSGTTVAWHPDAQAPLDFANAVGRASRIAQAKKMRKARAASGNFGQAPFEWTAQKLKKLRQLENEGASREAQAKALGCSRATLQRKIRNMTSMKGAE
ncbi:MAG: hypothetical protein AAFR98_12125 [Pseudomonadota bacterium]